MMRGWKLGKTLAAPGLLVISQMLPVAVRGLATSPIAPNLREQVVRKYFDGVNKKDRAQIASCFSAEGARIRDVCGVSSMEKDVSQDILADRCMEFLAAHPDCKVDFHFPPTCGRDDQTNWVFCHWYETGTWSGESLGLKPEGTPLTVEGQTRFHVSDDLLITQLVVTRTFSDWEKAIGSQIDK